MALLNEGTIIRLLSKYGKFSGYMKKSEPMLRFCISGVELPVTDWKIRNLNRNSIQA